MSLTQALLKNCRIKDSSNSDFAEAPVHPSRISVCPELIEGTNGGAVVEDFPFMLSRVEAFLEFFSGINNEG
jgi:hypothetical protein